MLESSKEGFSLEKFLDAREERVEKQKKILETHKGTLIVVRANYPGEAKNEYPSTEIVKIISSEVDKYFGKDIIYKDETLTLEGTIDFFIVKLDVDEVKKICVLIEEKHPLGRFVDIDVYDNLGNSFSRTKYGYPQRKCYLCEELAVVCTRAMKHNLKDIKNHILKSYEKYLKNESLRIKISEKLGELALKACILELSCHPSFGLVSPLTSGAHKDMNYFTFLNSSFAIKRGLTEMSYLGFSYLDINEIFKRSRDIGIQAEKEMFLATKNINTHKGIIFIFGVTLVSVAKVLYEKYIGSNQDISSIDIDNKELEKVSENIRKCCVNILADFDRIPEKIRLGEKLTNGEKLYLDYGFLGIRGEVKDGMSFIFQEILPFLEKEMSVGHELNFSLVKTLLFLMTKINDSTIVNRVGVEVLESVKNDAKLLLSKGVPLDEAFELEERYSKSRISPGGSADLLAITIFLYFLKNEKLS